MDNPYDNIESFLNGELQGKALIDFEDALRTDTDLAEAVNAQRQMLQQLDFWRLKTKVETALAHPPTPKRSPTKYLFWAICAALLSGGVAWWIAHPRKTQPPVSPPTETPTSRPIATQPIPSSVPPPDVKIPPGPAHTTPPTKWRSLAQAQIIAPEMTQLRGEIPVGNGSDALKNAELAYQSGDYKKVLRLLSTPDGDDEAAPFLRAHAHFQLGDYALAGRAFAQLERSFQYRHEARWNAMLCQLAQGDTAAARRALRIMQGEAAFPYQDKAARVKDLL
jgi:tetratricopeptide (TPR) repeat protein